MCTRSSCRLNTFCTSRRLAELWGPKRFSPPMSMSPVGGAAGHERRERLRVFAWTFWPIRVRLKPIGVVFSVRDESTSRCSPVKNWLRDRNSRGNCG